MAVYDSVHPETMGSVFSIGKYGVLDMAVGTYIERARNDIAKRAVENDNEYLLFVDADMVFEVEDLFKLKDAMDADPKIGAVAGLYVYRDSTVKPVAHWIEDDMWQSGMYVLNRTLKNMEEGVVDDVDVFGTGFMLIRTEALKSFGDPYFKTKVDDSNGTFWGEDALLAKRLKDNGWRACIHFGVQVGHIGRAAFYPKELLNIDIPEAEEAIKAAGMRERKDAV
jgi:glycosyltransferase involved in cell wall biosynthesis